MTKAAEPGGPGGNHERGVVESGGWEVSAETRAGLGP